VTGWLYKLLLWPQEPGRSIRKCWELLRDPRVLRKAGWHNRTHVQQTVKDGVSTFHAVCDVPKCGWESKPISRLEIAYADGAFHAGRQHAF